MPKSLIFAQNSVKIPVKLYKLTGLPVNLTVKFESSDDITNYFFL